MCCVHLNGIEKSECSVKKKRRGKEVFVFHEDSQINT